jgi:tRNA pseudouridine55 synthase
VTVRHAEGVLLVDKPEGPTSHDVVQAARKALGERRVGHTGTLDPFASGLLLLCVGRWTRLVQFLTGLDKTYDAVARLGVSTDTEDREGTVLEETSAWTGVTVQAVEDALGELRGDIVQTPPAFSAKKVGGIASHRRARRGQPVELAPQHVKVHELVLTDLDLPRVGFHVRCSSGTYVRSLARDLGRALGVGAHLVGLRRTAVGSFSVSSALPAARLDHARRVEDVWMTPLEALAHLPRVELSSAEVAAVRHGRPVPAVGGGPTGPAAATFGDRLVAVGEVTGTLFRPRKVFADG